MAAAHRHLLSQRQEITMNSTHHLSFRLAFLRLWLLAASADVKTRVSRLSERRRQRYALSLLDRRLQKDIGLSREAVQDELKRPFWR
jgi:uncharacterized protein YjiS (DUF1127 family)